MSASHRDRIIDVNVRGAELAARSYLAVVRQKPVDVDRFARLALKGIQRNRGIVVVPTSARTRWCLQR